MNTKMIVYITMALINGLIFYFLPELSIAFITYVLLVLIGDRNVD